jgi:hypothetical protein
MTLGLTNTFINQFLKPRCRDYRGTFSSDNIPSNLKHVSKFSIICNLSKRGKIGSHFIGIFAFPQYVIYFDSIGLPAFVESICDFLRSLNRPIVYNQRQIQHLDSYFCGFYTILYCMRFDVVNIDTPVKIIFNDDNLIENDNTCIEYIKILM